jgi:hypothetical protein
MTQMIISRQEHRGNYLIKLYVFYKEPWVEKWKINKTQIEL